MRHEARVSFPRASLFLLLSVAFCWGASPLEADAESCRLELRVGISSAESGTDLVVRPQFLPAGSETSIEDVRPAPEPLEELLIPASEGMAGASLALYLEPELWQIGLDAPGYWAPAIAIPETCLSEPVAIDFELLPTGSIVAELEPGFDSPIRASFGLAPTSDPRREEGLPLEAGKRYSTPCGREENEENPPRTRMICEVPAGRFDLKLEAGDFAPHYLWDSSIVAGQTMDLGRLVFVEGASLVGWIEIAEVAESAAADDSPIRGESGSEEVSTRLRLSPQLTGWIEDPVQRKRLESRAYSVTANSRGFFQFRGLPEGVFELSAQRPGYLSNELEEIRIEAAQEHALESPILLEPPIGVEVFIDPPTNPRGQPWLLELMAPLARSQVMKVLTRSAADSAGYWQYRGVSAGPHTLGIFDQEGSHWWQGRIEAHREMSPVFVEIGAVEVRGQVHWKGEPVRTSIVFGTRQRRPHVRVESNSEGEFRTVLPRAGTWRLEVEVDGHSVVLDDVEVEAAPGKAFAWVDIPIPATEIAVEVTKDGLPAVGVSVILRDLEKDQRGASSFVEDEGEVTFRGLPPGKYAVIALNRAEESAPVNIELEEDEDYPPVRIELRAKTRVSGNIVHQGMGVVGARVFLFPALSTDPMTLHGEGVSDPTGAFEVAIPPGTQVVDAVSVATGFGTVIERRVLPEDRDLGIALASEKGDILLQSPEYLGHVLHHAGAAVPLARLLTSLALPDPEGRGLLLGSMRPGSYSLCPGAEPSPDCLSGNLAPSGVLAF